MVVVVLSDVSFFFFLFAADANCKTLSHQKAMACTNYNGQVKLPKWFPREDVLADCMKRTNEDCAQMLRCMRGVCAFCGMGPGEKLEESIRKAGMVVKSVIKKPGALQKCSWCKVTG